jgi:hypothetical protein
MRAFRSWTVIGCACFVIEVSPVARRSAVVLVPWAAEAAGAADLSGTGGFAAAVVAVAVAAAAAPRTARLDSSIVFFFPVRRASQK